MVAKLLWENPAYYTIDYEENCYPRTTHIICLSCGSAIVQVCTWLAQEANKSLMTSATLCARERVWVCRIKAL